MVVCSQSMVVDQFNQINFKCEYSTDPQKIIFCGYFYNYL